MVQHSLKGDGAAFLVFVHSGAADDGNWFDPKAATRLYIPILLKNWFIKKCKQSRAFVVFVLMSSVIRFSIPKILQTCLDPYLLVTTRTYLLVTTYKISPATVVGPKHWKGSYFSHSSTCKRGNCVTWSQNQNFPGIFFMAPQRGDMFFISMLCVWSILSYHIYNKLHPLVATCYWRGHMVFEASTMPMPAGSWVAGAIWFWRNFSTAGHLTVMGFFSWNRPSPKNIDIPPGSLTAPTWKKSSSNHHFQGVCQTLGCLTSFWFPGWSKVMPIKIIDWFDMNITKLQRLIF